MWAGLSEIREHEALLPSSQSTVKPEGSFPTLTAKGRQPRSGAAESKQSRSCPCLAHPSNPSIPSSLPPSAALESAEVSRAEPKLSHQEETIKQTETEWSDTCQSCTEEAFTTYLCSCENRMKKPRLASRSLPKFPFFFFFYLLRALSRP